MNHEKFFAKIKKTESCWEWIASKNGKYGQYRINKKLYFAHRYSYKIHKGEIPEGMVIDHLCKNTICVNPDHLECVTQQINVDRGDGRAKKTCGKGHIFDEKNTRIIKRKNYTVRQCRKCDNEMKKNKRKMSHV